MNNKEFLNAVEVLHKEKGIDEDTIYEAMELAMASAYKKHSGLENVRVEIDRKKGDIKIYSYLTVVSDDDFTDPDYEIIYEDALEQVPDIKIGETIETYQYNMGKYDMVQVDFDVLKEYDSDGFKEYEKINSDDIEL